MNRIKERLRLSDEGLAVLYEISLFFLGFILTSVRFLFGTYPFGIALVGASKKHTPFVVAGSLLSVIFLMDGDAVYIVAMIALLGLRVASSFIRKSDIKKTELGESNTKHITRLLFCDGRELRVAVSALVALGIGTYRVLSGGYNYYDIFVLIFNTVFVSVLAFCMCGLFERENRKYFLVGACSVAFALVYFFSGKELQGIDITLLLSFAAVLYISKNMNGISAGITGLILGIAQGGILSGVLGIGGIVSGFLWGISPYLAVMCSFILSMGYGVSLLGYEAIVYLVPELLAASLIMYPLLRFELLPKLSTPAKSEAKEMKLYRLGSISTGLRKKIGDLSEAYKGVSSALKGVSQKTKSPDKRGYLDMSLEVCEAHCYSCPKHGICWERDVVTTQSNIDRMGEALFVRHRVEKDDVEEKFLHRCPNIETIMDQLNAKSKEILAHSVKNDKLEVCALDYDATAKIISAMFKKEKEHTLDKALTDRAVRAGARCGLVCGKIEVMGTVGKRVVATDVDMQRSKCTSLALKQEMEKALGISLKEPQTEESDECVVLTMESENRLRAECAAISYPLEKEGVNGDSNISFEADHRQYMLICDGMGSGQDAHLTSELCVELLSKMLRVTDEKQAVLSMLNNLIRAKNTECSSTVDLLEINLLSGEGRLVKSGACPSFVKRGTSVFKLQSKTAPLGIMKGLDAEELSFNVEKGDVCVMVSDGVISSKQDVHWLMEYLKEFSGSDPQTLCKGIMREAKRKGIKDDVTVACAVIN